MKSALLVVVAACGVLIAHAQDATALVGVWKLLSYEIEFKDGTPPSKLFGDNPPGYLIFTAKGRMMALLEAADRKAAATPEDWARLMLSMGAYSGTYRLEADKWITTVDVAWLPSYRTEQVRDYKIEGDRLTVLTPWGKDPRLPQPSDSRQVLIWQKVE